MELLPLFITILVALVGGIRVFVFLAFVVINHADFRNQDAAQELESEIITRQKQRSDKKVEILYLIGQPECPDGRYSPNQIHMWRRFNAYDRHDQIMRKHEREAMIRARGG